MLEHSSASTTACATCHGGNAHAPARHGAGGGIGSCAGGGGCHGTSASHLVHTSSAVARGPDIGCADCHDPDDIPTFADGNDLAATSVCDGCHSPGGTFNGVTSIAGSIGAKNNWSNLTTSSVYEPGGMSLRGGKGKWCIGCHDQTSTASRIVSAGVTQTAANKAGDGVTYGYYVTGHGRETTFAAMAHQAPTETANPAAGRSCTACHDALASHISAGPASSRIRVGYEDDATNADCRQCHDPGAEATRGPVFYTTYATYAASVHKGKKCSDCHDVHGMAGPATGMTKGDKENLCYQCHAGHAGHALGAQFGKGGKRYALRCTSCHNVHVISGRTTTQTPGVSDISLFSNNTTAWGDGPGEKMRDYAGTGRYQTPAGDSLDATQQPDYPTFCLDCHGTAAAEFGKNGGITWAGDNHGRVSANVPNGVGASPNWYTYGKAAGWDGDDVVGTEAEAWPVTPRGRGEQIWSRSAYSQDERIGGANFVLSCSDCHVTHETGIGAKLRGTVNGNPGSTIWNTQCNACHYYYSDWHAGMSCGSASCHVSQRMTGTGRDSIHSMASAGGDGSTRTFNQDLVLDLRFEDDLNDSGTYRLHSKWFNLAGSYGSGRYGRAVSLDGDQSVQVGTTNQYWSTDEGYHGTWKYTEMKYNTTLEAWVNPTETSSTEYSLFTKHVGYANGGYGLSLKKIDGTWRTVLNVNMEGTSTAIRGAYGSVPVPAGRWTHVAASFDASGPARDPADPSAGRVRVWVNGEDVTWSSPFGVNAQPGSGETTIYPFSRNAADGNLVGYDNPGTPERENWCASEFSVGGFDWQPGFVGSIDQAKVWNVTKPAPYFAAVDQASPPRVAIVEGAPTSDTLAVRLSEGVWSNPGGSGALAGSDFVLADADNGRTITGVSHTAGNATATVTLSSALDTSNDLNVDTVRFAAGAVYDEYDNPGETVVATVAPFSGSPAGDVVFDLNEAPGSAYVSDSQGVVWGGVIGAGAMTGSSFSGDGASRYVDFQNNSRALLAETTMTVAARIKPTGLAGATGSYVRRVVSRSTGTGDWQMSVWRIPASVNATDWGEYTPPPGVASIALWVRVADTNGGDAWKPVLTESEQPTSAGGYPIVSDHWYRVRAVWNTYKPGGTPGQPFVPANIYIDDEGTDGAGAGELWSGYVDATDADQSQFKSHKKLYTNDRMLAEEGAFRIGANTPGAGNYFEGLIDWVIWKPTADYGGMAAPRVWWGDGLRATRRPPAELASLAAAVGPPALRRGEPGSGTSRGPQMELLLAAAMIAACALAAAGRARRGV